MKFRKLLFNLRTIVQTLRLLLLFLPLVSFGQTEYYVSAKGGLNVREAPNSKKVATLLYGEIVRIVSKTGEKLIINDTDEKTGMTKAIEGEWVEIIAERIVDYDYKMMTDVFEKVKGYVFDGFLKQPTFSDYIKKDYTPISTLKYDENSCRTYKSGVPFTGIAYKIKYGPASKFASRQTSPSYIVDYGRFGEFISPIIIKIAEYKNGVLNGKQKVIDPLNDLTREKIVLFNSENGDGDKIIMKYSNFEIQYGDLQIYIRPTGVEFFDSSGLPASNFIANFSDDEESLFKLFQEDFKNKYLQITFNEEYVREAGEYSHFENDYNRKYSNYIDEECYMFKKPISVEIIENLVDGKFELIKEPIVYNEYTFEITDLSNSGKISSAYYTLWIDWNKDGNFSPELGGWDKSVVLQRRKEDFEGEKWKVVETMEIVESPKFSIVVYKNGEVFQNIKTPFDMQVDIPFDRRFFTVEDVNFDGYEDFYFTDYMGMVNISFIIYLYNSTSEKFEINEDYRSITSPRFDIDHQIIKSFTRGNAAYHESEIYIVLNDKLTRISKTIDDVGSNEYKYIIYDGEKEVAVNESLRKVKLNIAFFKTQKFNVIIDLLDNSNYRYASWSASKNLRNTPDLILKNGVKQETENEISYKFKKGEFSYVCIFNKLTSDGQLKVFQNKKELVKQEASVFIVPNEVKPYEGNKHKITLDIKNNLKD